MKNTMLRKSFKMPENIDDFNGYTVPEISQPYASSVVSGYLGVGVPVFQNPMVWDAVPVPLVYPAWTRRPAGSERYSVPTGLEPTNSS